MECSEDDCNECSPSEYSGDPDGLFDRELECGCFHAEHWAREGSYWAFPCREHIREYKLYTPVAFDPGPLRAPLLNVAAMSHPLPPLK